MQFQQTQPAVPVLTTDDLIYFLRIDPDTANNDSEVTLISNLIASATAYAEETMGCSLINRSITATYWGHAPAFGGTWFGGGRRHKLALPRGPIVSITSVMDNGNPVSNWIQEGSGCTDLLYLPSGWVGPLVVTYTAGYGADATTVPADIAQAIRQHVGTMYEYRESVTDKSTAVVPHSLEAFYQRKSRTLFAA